MGEYIDFNWTSVENTLSKRMIDDSLVHLFDRVQKKISKKTIILNKKLRRLHILKNYDHFIEVKTKIKQKLNDNSEYESSSIEESSSETSTNSTDVEDNIEKNKQNRQYENVHNVLSKDVPNDLIPVNNAASQSTNTDGKNESDIDNYSIENSMSRRNDDSIFKNCSDMINDDEIGRLIIDGNSTEESINTHDNNDILKNSSPVIDDSEDNQLETHSNLSEELTKIHNNNDLINNYSDVLNNDEESESDIFDTSTKESINRPENDNIIENYDKDTVCKKNKPTPKIVMTEIFKPKYTVIQNLKTFDTIEKNIPNRKSPEKLLNDVGSIELQSSQEDNSSNQKNNQHNINNSNSMDSTQSEKTILNKRQGIKDKNKRSQRKKIILNNNQNVRSHLSNTSRYMNGSDTNLENVNKSMVEDKETVDHSNMGTNNTYLSKTNGNVSGIESSKSQSSLNDRAALSYTSEHMAYVKNRQTKFSSELQLFNDNYIYIENKSKEDLILEQENNLLQSNVLTRRPMTLDEYVKNNDLVSLDDKTSVFSLDDLSDDDDIFLMEMPKSAINQELLGQKMVVRNFSIKIGSTNYKLQRMKNDTLTCILRENNEKVSLKAVNIKPKATFAVKKILEPSTEDIDFHRSFNIINHRSPFPENLKIRNPLENNNKRLKKYKKKIHKDKKKKKKKV